jgi:proline racemase
MRRASHIAVTYTHTEGEPTCFVMGGIPWPAGTDILEKRRFFDENYAWLRRALLREPRGHAEMYGGFLAPPSRPDADIAVLWCEDGAWHEMCGHGTIALGMLLAAEGKLPVADGRATLRIEAPTGLIEAEIGIDAEGAAQWCRFENAPAFVAAQDVPLTLPGFGEFAVDIAYGGNFYAALRWDHPDHPVRPEQGRFFAELGPIARDQLRKKVPLRHPELPHIDELHFVTFYQDSTRPDAFHRSVHVFGGGKLDRCPSGTGTSAMLANYAARGKIAVGQTIRTEGLLGSGVFEGTVLRETTVGGRPAIVPAIKGRAHLTGHATWIVDPEDPLAEGFVIG